MSRHRRLFLRRAARLTLVWLVLPFAFLLTLRLIWGYEADRRLVAIRAKFHAQGFACDIEDFPDASSVTGKQSAYPVMKEALDKFSPTLADSPLLNLSPDRLELPENIAGLAQIAGRNQAAINGVDAAMGLPWFPPTRDEFQFYITHDDSSALSKSRRFAKLFYGAAIASQREHNEREALRNVRRILLLSTMAGHEPLYIAHLVQAYLRAMAAQAVETMEPGLALSSQEARDEAANLLAEFQSNVSFSETLWRVWEGESVFMSDASKEMSKVRGGWWIEPLAQDDVAQTLDHRLSSLPLLQRSGWKNIKSYYEAIAATTGGSYLNETVRGDFEWWYSDERVVQLHLRMMSDNGAAIMLLAARLYALVHGAPPSRAADMIPQFLATLPPDPFSPVDQPLHYRLDALGPTVWSVGEDEVDDGGTLVVWDSDGDKNRYNYQKNDGGPVDFIYGAAWRSTSPRKPATSPRTRPAR